MDRFTPNFLLTIRAEATDLERKIYLSQETSERGRVELKDVHAGLGEECVQTFIIHVEGEVSNLFMAKR